MTPPTPRPLRCDHECVCRHHFPSAFAAGIECKDTCKYDTRKIPAVNVEKAIAELERRRGLISARNDETPLYLTQGNTNDAAMWAYDEAIALLKVK